ncbi:MAG TPA: type II secretion system protein, partial [Verrucomicrobiae bacterium]|nr:type II secretion system protein [Verrucomicrobiae bacterium]
TIAFTMVEMLTVIAIIGILAAMLLPVVNRSEMRTKRVVCIHGLQQVGLAFHVFSNDHNGKFPTAISTNDGGSLEYVESGFESGGVFYSTFRHFQTLSNELVFPQTVVCPSETTRPAAASFPGLQNENLSYFIGVQSTFDKPTSILAGDRNLSTNSYNQPTILQLGPLSRLAWTWELHQFKGNVLIADGHVEQWNDADLISAESASPFNQSLFLPSVPPGSGLQFAGGTGGSGTGSGGSGGSGSSGTSGSGPGGSSSADSGGMGSGSNAPSSDQWAPWFAQSSANNNGTTSPPSQSASPPAGNPSLTGSSGEQTVTTETVSQAGPPDALLARTVPPAAVTGTDAVVSTQDSGAGMSPFDQHMTMVMQHSLAWFYLLLCILVLLYLLNRLRKRMRKDVEEE